MSNDCWGPSPNDMALAWKLREDMRRERQKKTDALAPKIVAMVKRRAPLSPYAIYERFGDSSEIRSTIWTLIGNELELDRDWRLRPRKKRFR